MKHEWRKKEKDIYLPPSKPVRVTIPPFKFFTVAGAGNPNDEKFPEYIQALYSLAYGVRMSPKKNIAPDGYFEYTVYPLEGVWDISDEAKKNYSGKLDKDTLVFKIMIRQPDFVDEKYAKFMIKETKKKKPKPLLDEVKFEIIEEGDCIQMMHIGSYDNEQQSFDLMEAFAEKLGVKRISKIHREIYFSDPRNADPEKMKTLLRFKISDS